MIRRVLAVLLFALLSAIGVSAQTAVTYTSLSAAVTGGNASPYQTSVTLAATTGVSAASLGAPQTILDVDGEAMGVLTVNTTTKVATVIRGYQSSRIGGHESGAIVIVAPVDAFHAEAPAPGSCSQSGTDSSSYTPWIVTGTGVQWICDSGGTKKWLPVVSTGAITPAASSAAIQTAGQTFTLDGTLTGDPIALVSAPVPTSLCPLVQSSVTAANTVTLYFTTLTAAACTPAAGTYMFYDPLLNSTKTQR